MNEADGYGPVFIVCQNRRAAGVIKKWKRLPKGSKVIVDPCLLKHYISDDELNEIKAVAQAKEQIGVN